MPIDKDLPLTVEKASEALQMVGLTSKIIEDFQNWELHDQLIAIPWNSSAI